MSTFSLDNFRNQVLGSGLARTNRFEVIIPVPNGMNNFYRNHGRLISLFCEETNFPPLIVSTKSYKIFGPSFQRPVSAEYGGEGLSMTFHVDSDMLVKRFFEEWTYTVVTPYSFQLNYEEDYVVDITIHQLDETDNITYTCKLINAFPRSINLMPLNNSAQNQTHRLTVMFAYRYWDSALNGETTEIINTVTPFQPPPTSRAFTKIYPKEKEAKRQFNPTTGNLENNTPGSDLPISA